MTAESIVYGIFTILVIGVVAFTILNRFFEMSLLALLLYVLPPLAMVIVGLAVFAYITLGV